MDGIRVGDEECDDCNLQAQLYKCVQACLCHMTKSIRETHRQAVSLNSLNIRNASQQKAEPSGKQTRTALVKEGNLND